MKRILEYLKNDLVNLYPCISTYLKVFLEFILNLSFLFAFYLCSVVYQNNMEMALFLGAVS